MEMPKDTPSVVAALVTECWAKEPGDRPGFSKIHDILSKEFKLVHGGGGGEKKDENVTTKKEKKSKK